MPKEDNTALKPPAVDSAVDDTDEVVDLLEVVKPGKAIAADAEDVDFSADLESMLDSLSQAEQARTEQAPGEPQPFPDPTPVEHEVDHDESLDLPGMEDLDSILNSLSPGDAGAAKRPAAPAAAPVDTPGAGPQAASQPASRTAPQAVIDMPDLDALPATGLPGAASAPGEDAAAASAQKAVDIDDDFLETLLTEGGDAAAAPQSVPGPDAAPDAGPDAASGEAVQEDPFEALKAMEEAAAEKEEAALPPLAGEGEITEASDVAPAGDDDDLAASLETAVGDIASESIDSAAAEVAAGDAFEDARAAGQEVPPPAPQTQAAPEPSAMEEGDASAPPAEGAPAPEAATGSRFEEVDLNELDALLDDMLAAAPASGPATPPAVALPAPGRPDADPAVVAFPPEALADALAGFQSMAADLAALRDEMEDLRHAIDDAPAAQTMQTMLDSQASALAAQAARLEDIELTLAARAGEEQSAVARVQELEGALTKVEDRLTALEGQLADMTANLDTMAAEAAARVIREEIAALMAEG